MMQAANSNAEAGGTNDFVTVFVGETMFGLPINRVHDVFIPAGVTPVPLAPPEIVGLLNLRGRVVTALCLRRRLSLPDRAGDANRMAIGLEQGGETFALIVDGVGEVLKLGADTHEPVPINLDARWRDRRAWWRSSLLNTARMAWFSSDRTIGEYAAEIWNVPVGHA